MASLRGFIVGILFTFALFLVVLVPIHLAIGVNELIFGIQSGKLNYIAAAGAAAIMALLSGFKLAVSWRAIGASIKFPST